MQVGPEKSTDPKKKLKKKTVYLGVCATLLLGSGAVLYFSHASPHQPAPQTSVGPTVEEKAKKKPKKTHKKQEKKATERSDDIGSSVLEHFGMTANELTPETFIQATDLSPTELVQVTNALAKQESREGMAETLADEVPAEKEILPSEDEGQGNGNSHPAPVWLPPALSANLSQIVMDQGEVFDPWHYFTVHYGSDTEAVISINNIDTSVCGTQYLIIEIVDSKGYGRSLAIPVVVNAIPVLSLSEDHVFVPIGVQMDLTKYAIATDAEDGELTPHISMIENVDFQQAGTYPVTYRIQDKFGATASATLQVTVTNEAPVISDADMQLQVFDAFDQEAYLSQIQVTDREDEYKNLNIQFEADREALNAVNTSIPGMYEVLLSATDSDGNKASIVGKIEVVNDSPVFSGVADRIHIEGEDFDPLAGVDVKDREENISRGDIRISGDYDANLPGTYRITLSIGDSFTTTEARFTLTVLPKKEPGDEQQKVIPLMETE